MNRRNNKGFKTWQNSSDQQFLEYEDAKNLRRLASPLPTQNIDMLKDYLALHDRSGDVARELPVQDLLALTSSIIEITINDALNIITGSSEDTFTPGRLYKITGMPEIPSGFITVAVSDRQVSPEGVGGFLNPDFQGIALENLPEDYVIPAKTTSEFTIGPEHDFIIGEDVIIGNIETNIGTITDIQHDVENNTTTLTVVFDVVPEDLTDCTVYGVTSEDTACYFRADIQYPEIAGSSLSHSGVYNAPMNGQLLELMPVTGAVYKNVELVRDSTVTAQSFTSSGGATGTIEGDYITELLIDTDQAIFPEEIITCNGVELLVIEPHNKFYMTVSVVEGSTPLLRGMNISGRGAVLDAVYYGTNGYILIDADGPLPTIGEILVSTPLDTSQVEIIGDIRQLVSVWFPTTTNVVETDTDTVLGTAKIAQNYRETPYYLESPTFTLRTDTADDLIDYDNCSLSDETENYLFTIAVVSTEVATPNVEPGMSISLGDTEVGGFSILKEITNTSQGMIAAYTNPKSTDKYLQEGDIVTIGGYKYKVNTVITEGVEFISANTIIVLNGEQYLYLTHTTITDIGTAPGYLKELSRSEFPELYVEEWCAATVNFTEGSYLLYRRIDSAGNDIASVDGVDDGFQWGNPTHVYANTFVNVSLGDMNFRGELYNNRISNSTFLFNTSLPIQGEFTTAIFSHNIIDDSNINIDCVAAEFYSNTLTRFTFVNNDLSLCYMNSPFMFANNEASDTTIESNRFAGNSQISYNTMFNSEIGNIRGLVVEIYNNTFDSGSLYDLYVADNFVFKDFGASPLYSDPPYIQIGDNYFKDAGIDNLYEGLGSIGDNYVPGVFIKDSWGLTFEYNTLENSSWSNIFFSSNGPNQASNYITGNTCINSQISSLVMGPWSSIDQLNLSNSNIVSVFTGTGASLDSSNLDKYDISWLNIDPSSVISYLDLSVGSFSGSYLYRDLDGGYPHIYGLKLSNGNIQNLKIAGPAIVEYNEFEYDGDLNIIEDVNIYGGSFTSNKIKRVLRTCSFSSSTVGSNSILSLENSAIFDTVVTENIFEGDVDSIVTSSSEIQSNSFLVNSLFGPTNLYASSLDFNTGLPNSNIYGDAKWANITDNFVGSDSTLQFQVIGSNGNSSSIIRNLIMGGSELAVTPSFLPEPSTETYTANVNNNTLVQSAIIVHNGDTMDFVGNYISNAEMTTTDSGSFQFNVLHNITVIDGLDPVVYGFNYNTVTGARLGSEVMVENEYKVCNSASNNLSGSLTLDGTSTTLTIPTELAGVGYLYISTTGLSESFDTITSATAQDSFLPLTIISSGADITIVGTPKVTAGVDEIVLSGADAVLGDLDSITLQKRSAAYWLEKQRNIYL